MIRLIKKSALQKFAITVSELSVLQKPFFLFVFINDMTNEEKKIVLIDQSTHKARYNLFEISGDFFNGEGWYTYKVFEQEIEDNIDLEATVGLVEIGRAFIATEDESVFQTIPNEETKFYEYNGD
jgi:hypothetical protein